MPNEKAVSLGRRKLEVLGILLIGDGVVGALIPTRHSRRWLSGPEWWRRTMRVFVERPNLTRVLSVGELALGLWLAIRDSSKTVEDHHARGAV